jgi:hypothetical protein
MSVNRLLPHVLVLPEDRANRQLANGFHLQVPPDRQRQMQVLPEANGWERLLHLFREEHATGMLRFTHRHMVLLIDFDNDATRLGHARTKIPADVTDRVFIVGALRNPEALKQAGLGSYEHIGSALAQDCRDETNAIWGHQLLQHNAGELNRLREHIRPILFPIG